VGVSHLELFGTREAVARAKVELLEALPADGFGVMPTCDDFLALASDAAAARLLTVGGGGMVRYGATRVDPEGSTHGWIELREGIFDVVLPVGGRPLMRNAALALAASYELGVDPRSATEAISRVRPSQWRMQVMNAGGRRVVNDAYNSNPTSLQSALRTVAEMARTSGCEAWAVLGAMTELGGLSLDSHRRAGRLAAALGFNGLVVLGEGAEGICHSSGGIAHSVGSLEEAAEAVDRLAAPDALVLIKASRAVGLEPLAELLVSLARSRRT
jgi:UDP-N-acetylmuramoyl-tripeptide--D-alanyl-D-alanine ligase